MVIELIAAAALLSNVAVSLSPQVVPSVRDRASDIRVGSCESSDTRYNLHRLLFVSNRTISVDDFGQVITWSLDGERARVESGGFETTYRVDTILDDEEDIDLRLSFASLDGHIYVYWRETYEHRTFKQGLLEMDGVSLRPLCEGVAGLYSSH